MKKLLVGLTILATTYFANAAVTGITKIKYMYVYDNFIVITMQNTHSNPDGCTHSQATKSLYLATNSDAGKRMYAAALTAKASGERVRIGYKNCASWGSKTLPKVYSLIVLN